jgi:hypothetical protein
VWGACLRAPAGWKLQSGEESLLPPRDLVLVQNGKKTGALLSPRILLPQSSWGRGRLAVCGTCQSEEVTPHQLRAQPSLRGAFAFSLKFLFLPIYEGWSRGRVPSCQDVLL